jgi:hypothetical protein
MSGTLILVASYLGVFAPALAILLGCMSRLSRPYREGAALRFSTHTTARIASS